MIKPGTARLLLLALLFAAHRRKRWTTFHLLFIDSTFSGQQGLQDIEKLDTDVKDKIYFVIDNIIQNVKAKKALAS